MLAVTKNGARFLQAGLESIRQIVAALDLPEGTQMG